LYKENFDRPTEPKEALIGEAITSYSSHKEALIGIVLLGYKQVITQYIHISLLLTLVLNFDSVITKIPYLYTKVMKITTIKTQSSLNKKTKAGQHFKQTE